MSQPDFAKILYEGHPADGTERAAYQFLISGPKGEPVRFLLVEAENAWAVCAIEKILLRDAKVSDNCRIIAVFRDHRVAGVRDDLLEEVPYADFMVDIVDPERLTGSDVVLACFSKSVSREQMAYVLERVKEASEGATARAPAAPKPRVDLNGEKLETVTSALCGMGFKKSEVKKFVAGVSGRPDADVPDLIREGLAALAA